MKKKNQSSQYETRRNDSSGKTVIRKYFLAAGIGFSVFLIAVLVLSFTGALVVSKSDDPARLIPFVSTVSMSVASILGGLVCSKKSGGSPMLSTVLFLSTIVFATLLMTLIYLKESSATPLWKDLLLKIPVMLGGLFGGFIGSIKKKPKSLYAKYK